MQKFTLEELAKFKAADPDDVVCVRVGQIAVLIEQNEQFLAKDVRSEEAKAEYRSKNAVLEQRISDLKRSSKLNSHNSSKPPSSDRTFPRYNLIEAFEMLNSKIVCFFR